MRRSPGEPTWQCPAASGVRRPRRRGSTRPAAGLAALAAGLAACGAPAAPGAARCAGTFVIGAQAALDAIARCPRIDGSVAIRSAAPLRLGVLDGVREVSGDLVIGPTLAVDELALRGLRRVGGALRLVSNGVATGAFLPELEAAADVEIGGNLSLATVSAPRLAEVAGGFTVVDNPSLEVLLAPRLRARAVTVERNVTLTVVEVPGVAPPATPAAPSYTPADDLGAP